MKKSLLFLALIGFTLSLIIHISSILAINIIGVTPLSWILSIGIFVIWIPIILELKQDEELNEITQHGKIAPLAFFKIVHKGLPAWMSVFSAILFMYSFLNFMYFIAQQQGSPSFEAGKYVLRNHDKVLKIITKEAYNQYKSIEMRAFSGHWLLFYGIGSILLYKFSNFLKNQI